MPHGFRSVVRRTTTLAAIGLAVVASALVGAAASSAAASARVNTSSAAILANPNVGEVLMGFRDSRSLTGLTARSLGLDLQPGSYNITAKLFVVNNNSEKVTVSCRLQFGNSFDDSSATMTLNNERQAMAFNVANNVSVLTSVGLTCSNNVAVGDVTLAFVKITASRVGFAHISGLLG